MAIIRPFRASFPDLRKVNDTQEFYGNAKQLFPVYVASNIYQKDKRAAFYIYEQNMIEGSHTAVIALASIEEYMEGKIVKHEGTLAEKEAIMLGLLEERNAMIKPTLLTYNEDKSITGAINRFKEKYTREMNLPYLKCMHRIWKVTEAEDIKELAGLFEKIPKTYIADGHHRAATSYIRYKKLKAQNPDHTGDEFYNFLLSAYFSENQLKIHEFNRVVLTLNNYSTSGFRQELRKDFIIEKCTRTDLPQSKYEMGMYVEQKWYKLQPKKHLTEGTEYERLAVSVWNKYILQKVLDIQDVRADNRIKYVEGPKGITAIEKKVGRNNFAVGFTFFPVEIQDLMAIADAGLTMPPKSTWFTPRMRNGILAQIF